MYGRLGHFWVTDDMTDRDEIAELADRICERQRRSEAFEIEFFSLTADEQDQLVALLKGRAAHGQERLEALEEDHRIGLAICALLESSGASGLTLWEAGLAGYITARDLVESIRSAVPDPDQ